MTVEERRRRRFSEQFRQETVKQIETKELTITQVSKLYEVKAASVRRWIRKYGDGSYKDRIVVSHGEEIEAIKGLEKKIKDLKKVIAEQQIDLYYYKTAKSIAEQKLGVDFEKKT